MKITLRGVVTEHTSTIRVKQGCIEVHIHSIPIYKHKRTESESTTTEITPCTINTLEKNISCAPIRFEIESKNTFPIVLHT